MPVLIITTTSIIYLFYILHLCIINSLDIADGLPLRVASNDQRLTVAFEWPQVWSWTVEHIHCFPYLRFCAPCRISLCGTRREGDDFRIEHGKNLEFPERVQLSQVKWSKFTLRIFEQCVHFVCHEMHHWYSTKMRSASCKALLKGWFRHHFP